MKDTDTTPLSDAKFLKSEELMRLLGYSDRAAFWVAVKSAGIPHIKVNTRRALFEERAVRAWLNSRTVGGVARYEDLIR